MRCAPSPDSRDGPIASGIGPRANCAYARPLRPGRPAGSRVRPSRRPPDHVRPVRSVHPRPPAARARAGARAGHGLGAAGLVAVAPGRAHRPIALRRPPRARGPAARHRTGARRASAGHAPDLAGPGGRRRSHGRRQPARHRQLAPGLDPLPRHPHVPAGARADRARPAAARPALGRAGPGRRAHARAAARDQPAPPRGDAADRRTDGLPAQPSPHRHRARAGGRHRRGPPGPAAGAAVGRRLRRAGLPGLGPLRRGAPCRRRLAAAAAAALHRAVQDQPADRPARGAGRRRRARRAAPVPGHLPHLRRDRPCALRVRRADRGRRVRAGGRVRPGRSPDPRRAAALVAGIA
ncbi:conserved hypothetical protein, partial [Ricinus communis]